MRFPICFFLFAIFAKIYKEKMLSRRELYQERLRVANQRFSSTTDYVKVT